MRARLGRWVLLAALALPAIFAAQACDDGECAADRECLTGSVCAMKRCQPLACTLEFAPVCGSDGRTYSNACAARGAHVTVVSQGECPRSVR